MLSYYFQRAYSWLFPFACLLCGQVNKKFGLCNACQRELPWVTQGCQRCANPVPSISALCGKCLQKPPPYAQIAALFYYQPPIDYLLTSLKFGSSLLYARFFGELLAEKLQERYADQTKPELIIPMPLHAQRLQERGFNQALELSRPLAKSLAIPLSLKHCHRVLATQPQSRISALARQRNVRNAFAVVEAIDAKYVAIVDDIVTTGSTVAALAKVLRQAGVVKIDLWCCARAVYRT